MFGLYFTKLTHPVAVWTVPHKAAYGLAHPAWTVPFLSSFSLSGTRLS